jgi:hypothetical protein
MPVRHPERPVVTVEPLFADPSDARRVVELAHQFGRYRIYGEAEQVDLALSRGLRPREDSVQHFLRTGGARGRDQEVSIGTLASRTSYFREEYAYGGHEHAGGIEGFLHNAGLVDAARKVFDRPIVEPSIAFANLMLPGQELAVHTDVPEFRGVSRKNLPQWLLVVMHHSGLFDDWRLSIATGIAYFQDSPSGALRYWPAGPGSEPTRVPVRANTAVVLDTDSVFHGVDPVGDDVEAPRLATGATLAADEEDGTWRLTGAEGAPLGTFDWDQLRFSVSWKAYCFTDETDRATWRGGGDDLTVDAIVDRLVVDLVERGLVAPSVARDPELGRLLIDTYVRYPTTV